MKLPYRWVIVAIGALMTCVGIRAMFSLAVYLEPMSAVTGWSRAGISSAMTLDFLVMGVASFGWGMASDRFGTRVVVLAGAVLLGLGLLLASRTTSLIEFQLTYGVLVGMAFGPLAGGWIFDTFNSYSWLYIGSLSVAVGAIAMALAFLPLPLRPRDTLQPA